MFAKKAITRGFAAAVSAKSQPSAISSSSQIESKVSRLPNGLTIASIDLHGPVSSLVLAYRAGSRFQQPDELGLVHALRNSIGTDSSDYLGVKLLWQLGSVGGNLNAYATKDSLAVQLDVIRDSSPVAISLIGEFASPAFKPWDVHEATHNLLGDLEKQQPFDIVSELLHKAAYRNGALATPILTPPFQPHVHHEHLQNFARSRLVTSEAVLIGVNVDHDDLVGYGGQQSALHEGHGHGAPASPYVGKTDARQEAPTPNAHVMIAGEGVGLGDLKSIAVQEVLAALIGASPGQKFTNSANGGAGAVVASIVEHASNKRPVGVTAVNQFHAETGLIGVYVACEGEYADPIVRAAWKGLQQLASDGASEAQFTAAQQSAQLDALLHLEQPAHLALDQAHYVLANGELMDSADLAKHIGKVTADDIKKAAKKIIDKPSMAAYGRINQVPYVDQL